MATGNIFPIGGSAPQTLLIPCRYGAACYCTNPEHKKKYQHPPAQPQLAMPAQLQLVMPAQQQLVVPAQPQLAMPAQPQLVVPAKLPICKYGAACYRMNLKHLQNYQHPLAQPAQPQLAQFQPISSRMIGSQQAQPFSLPYFPPQSAFFSD